MKTCDNNVIITAIKHETFRRKKDFQADGQLDAENISDRTFTS